MSDRTLTRERVVEREAGVAAQAEDHFDAVRAQHFHDRLGPGHGCYISVTWTPPNSRSRRPASCFSITFRISFAISTPRRNFWSSWVSRWPRFPSRRLRHAGCRSRASPARRPRLRAAAGHRAATRARLGDGALQGGAAWSREDAGGPRPVRAAPDSGAHLARAISGPFQRRDPAARAVRRRR